MLCLKSSLFYNDHHYVIMLATVKLLQDEQYRLFKICSMKLLCKKPNIIDFLTFSTWWTSFANDAPPPLAKMCAFEPLGLDFQWLCQYCFFAGHVGPFIAKLSCWQGPQQLWHRTGSRLIADTVRVLVMIKMTTFKYGNTNGKTRFLV